MAAQSECAFKLRRLAVAGQTWINDNDGSMPDAMFWRLPNQEHQGSILPYLGFSDSQLDTQAATALSCPASFQELGPNADWNRGYSINIYACATENWKRYSPYDRHYLKMTAIPNPAAMAFFMDGNFLASGNAERKVGTASLVPWNYDDSYGFYARHPGARANVVFLDGHMERMSIDEFPQGSANEKRKNPFWGSNR